MRFLIDRIRYGGAPKTPQEADSLALRQLAGRGADLTKPRHVIHFLYFSAERDARTAADAIGEASWKTVVEAPTETIADWCVKADDHRIVGPDTVAAFRTWFEGVAETHGGEYDGWEAAAKP
jgi:Regulator of ribonuclease activity B